MNKKSSPSLIKYYSMNLVTFGFCIYSNLHEYTLFVTMSELIVFMYELITYVIYVLLFMVVSM